MIKIIEVKDKKTLKQFVYYVKKLYRNHKQYVFPIFYSLKKELKQEVLLKKKYKALLCLKENEVIGRILFTYDYHKDKKKQICFFSFFDCIDDIEVARLLFSHMEKITKQDGIDYIEGTFAPYDPDTRRGILIQGFEYEPVLFTSYNYSYYQNLIEECGFVKAYDTYGLKADVCDKTERVLNRILKFVVTKQDISISPLDLKKLDSEIEDIHQVLKESTTDANYQDAPSINMIRTVANNMKFFLEPQMIVIARENKTNKPVGFCLVLPDFNQVFKKTKGKIKPLTIMLMRKKISRARGVLQYVSPDYQDSGLIGAMFAYVYNQFASLGITEFEAGTILEENMKSISVFNKFGGKVIKKFRIYGKDV